MRSSSSSSLLPDTHTHTLSGSRPVRRLDTAEWGSAPLLCERARADIARHQIISCIYFLFIYFCQLLWSLSLVKATLNQEVGRPGGGSGVIVWWLPEGVVGVKVCPPRAQPWVNTRGYVLPGPALVALRLWAWSGGRGAAGSPACDRGRGGGGVGGNKMRRKRIIYKPTLAQ